MHFVVQRSSADLQSSTHCGRANPRSTAPDRALVAMASDSNEDVFVVRPTHR
jgi:hypothetical protein